ncbi:MAG: anaerobic ribonucleoside-triphosphate reductase [Burkholderiales bacterium]|jgi:hypothetical protein|nr:anaerobic ribonucleoside-triphosphate reductase [Burkholderiales bacterium]
MNHTKLNTAERTRCEVWTRVMGDHRPVAAVNLGKKSQPRERRFFREPKTAPFSKGVSAQPTGV